LYYSPKKIPPIKAKFYSKRQSSNFADEFFPRKATPPISAVFLKKEQLATNNFDSIPLTSKMVPLLEEILSWKLLLIINALESTLIIDYWHLISLKLLFSIEGF
jgi:hypothetical protein